MAPPDIYRVEPVRSTCLTIAYLWWVVLPLAEPTMGQCGLVLGVCDGGPAKAVVIACTRNISHRRRLPTPGVWTLTPPVATELAVIFCGSALRLAGACHSLVSNPHRPDDTTFGEVVV